MEDTLLALAAQNLVSPSVLFFGMGLGASLGRSDLSVPEAIARFLSLYLLISIGFRGGAEVAHQGLTPALALTILAGVVLSAGLPFIAYAFLRGAGLDHINAAAVAGHYGSISAVTFVAVTGALTQLALPYDGYMIAVAAAMETPAIFSALMIARSREGRGSGDMSGDFLREIALNGSIVALLGAFAVGCITGERGMTSLKPFLLDAFPGFLCVFLLDMGLIAGRGLRDGWKSLSVPVAGFAWIMPFIGAAFAALFAWLIGLSAGSTAVLMTLGASASYIAVPAAMRLALPAANPAIALTLSLGLTFPFNLIVGIPLYIAAAQMIAR
ncbi:membrane protein [Bradyrhizobium nitroreducens]|uniref:Membrane protein n=1 Tax=Bradyrhizobium nitroreducens TaxID=709803 RepID=A0A2M6UJ35_9BRAD|nr:membrane protein [Bradyrhizobium nitroreducens]TQF35849.1 membrane protein [Bradyrhizobium sp. UNPF46]